MMDDSGNREATAHRVLILRPDNLGDVILFSGALRHIRAHYPQAEITLCVKRYVRNLLELCPYVDKLVEWEHVSSPVISRFPRVRSVRGSGKLDRCVRYVFNRLHATDVLLLPVRSPMSGPYGMHEVTQTIPATARYGIAGDLNNQLPEDDQAAEAIYTARLRLSPERRQEHEFLVTRDFLRLLGIEVTLEDLWPEFWTDAADRRWAEEFMLRSEGAVILAVCPGVTNTLKIYPAASYAQVFRSLPGWRFNVALFGSASEKEVCDQVANVLYSCENVVSMNNLSGQTSLRQLVEGLRRCDAVLSVDSAAMHIGVALRKPVVGIMGGGHYGRFYPWGNPVLNRVVHKPMDCYWCNWQCRFPTVRCIQEIQPEAIANQLGEVLRMGAI